MLTQDVAVAPVESPLTLEGLALSDASGLVLEDAFLLPTGKGVTTVGAARYQSGDKRWSRRVALAGAVLQPGEAVHVTAVLKRAGDQPGRAAALTLTYRTDDYVYRRSNTTEYTLDDRCS